jgi:putative SOS response-associated peptidase YedK
MNIELLGAVRSAHPVITSPATGPSWPPHAGLTTTAWVEPGDCVCVTLLKLHGAQDSVELQWGQHNASTGELDFATWSEGKSFARPCLIPVAQVRQMCDSNGVTGWVAYKPKYGGSLAGTWVSADPHLYQPVAFKLLTAAAGPDLARYCTREPVFIPPEHHANWLNPKVSCGRLQKSSPEGTFTILEAE